MIALVFALAVLAPPEAAADGLRGGPPAAAPAAVTPAPVAPASVPAPNADPKAAAGKPPPATPQNGPAVAAKDPAPAGKKTASPPVPRQDPCSGPGGEARPGCERPAVLQPDAPATREAKPPIKPPEPLPASGPASEPEVKPAAAPTTKAGKSTTNPACAPAPTCAQAHPPFLKTYGLAVVGGALLLTALAVFAVFLRRRPLARVPTPQSDPPTALRRDLALVDEKGGQHRLAGNRLTPTATIGKSPTAALLLASPGVADTHALVWVRDGRLWLRPAPGETVVFNDRLLTNGAEIISSGDRIRLGSTEYWVMID